MAYIPKDAEWYLADIVMQITVDGHPENIVHTNLILIRADSPEQAYEEAVKLGAEGEGTWQNPDDRLVRKRFRGLRTLGVIHEKLEHGAELTYCEDRDMDEAAIVAWVTPKEELGVFSPIEPSKGPNYGSREIQDKLRSEFPHLFDSDGRRIV
ncbi:MAG: DUF4288 domain-containing protein [Bryobacteraceae bacterium]